MFNFKSQAEYELSRIEHLLEVLPKDTEKPKGSLIRRESKGKVTYLRRTSFQNNAGKREYSFLALGGPECKDCTDFKTQLYVAHLRNRLVNNQKALSKFLTAYKPYSQKEIETLFPRKYSDIPLIGLSLANKRHDRIIEWANAPYTQLQHKENSTIHYSMAGKKLPSKSEVIIANILESFGVPFRFSPQISLIDEDRAKVYRYPDFQFLMPDGEFKYWEHFGLLKKKEYVESTAEKLQLYALNGIIPGKNLVISADSGDGEIDSQWITNLVATHLLNAYKQH